MTEYSGIFRRTRLGLIATVSFLLCGCRGAERSTTQYLDAAMDVGRWLQALSVEHRAGYISDELSNRSRTSWNLGSGAAGRALFFVELFVATDDSSFLRSAQTELDGAVRLISEQPSPVDIGLFNGLSGVAYAFSEMFRLTGVPGHRDASSELARQVVNARMDDERWPASDDVLSGTAGIGLAMLSVAGTLGDSALLRFAIQLGDDLIERRRETSGGSWWSRSSETDLNLPNFSHGTAGVGYFLAALHRVTGEWRFGNVAREAAHYLIEIADEDAGLFLIPYGVPDDGYVTKYDIGWAHGPAGTANLFVALDPDQDSLRYRELVAAHARTLIATGMPGETLDPTRWASTSAIDRRFGTSGAAVFLARLGRYHGDAEAESLARIIADDILGRASRGSHGMYWEIPRYGFQGDTGTRAAFTGFLYGAAGLGLALLDVHYNEINGVPHLRWPDDAFALTTAVRLHQG